MLQELLNRRCCRSFDSNKPVEEEKINEIIKAGLHAPSGMNKQDGIIVAITNKEFRDKFELSEMDYKNERLLEILKENNYNIEKSFESLFK